MMDLSITNIIIIITCITSYIGFTQPSFFDKYKFQPYQMVRDRSVIQFVSAGFLHGDITHLLFNMMTLYSLGNAVESIFTSYFEGGIYIYILLYFTGIAAASAGDYYKHQHNPGYAAIGASGGTSAIIFSFIFFQPWARLSFFFLPPLPAIFLGVLYLVFSSYMARRGGDNIGHNAHFWGGVYGFLFTAIVAAVLRPEYLRLFINNLLG